MEVETFRSLEPGWRVVRIRRHAIRQAGEHLVGLEFAVGAQQLPWQRLHHRRLDVRSGGRRVASEVKLLEALVEREGAEQRREVGVLQPTPRKLPPHHVVSPMHVCICALSASCAAVLPKRSTISM